MTKRLVEAPLTTRNARSKLGVGTHWRAIDPDVHLGYRKGTRGGRWVVRWYKGDQTYAQATLATADDSFPADGSEIFDFAQATVQARKHVHQSRLDERAKADGPVLTVQDAVGNYLRMREAREERQNGLRGMRHDARNRLTKHVLSTRLAATPLHSLNEDVLRGWRSGLSKTLSASSVKRLVNDLKAALNQAANDHGRRLPSELGGIIRKGLRVEEVHPAAPRRQVLGDSDVRRIITSAWHIDRSGNWDGDLARMVVVLAATGARFSQLTRMKVGDVQTTERRLMVPVSRKGRGTKRVEHIAVPVGQDVIEALLPAINGRPGPEPLLERWRSRQVSMGQWVRDSHSAWNSASELKRPWDAISADAGLPKDIVPYALRHSSIVRGLRAGLPVRLVAALHDTSSAMIEKHYSAYVMDAMDELAARAIVPLVSTPAQVVPISRQPQGG